MRRRLLLPFSPAPATMLRLLGRNPLSNHLNLAVGLTQRTRISTFRRHTSTAPAGDQSLILYFLQHSCGLSLSAAIAVAPKVRLKSTKNAHSVLSLLKSHAFTKPHIARLVASRPQILAADPDNTLLPKLSFFRRLDIPGPDLARLLSSNPVLFLGSLPNRVIPNLAILRSVLGPDRNVISAIKGSPRLLLSDLPNLLLPKIEHLRSHGMSEQSIARLVQTHPRYFTEKTNDFAAAFAAIAEMGIRPSASMFAHALGVLARVPKPVWEAKMNNYKSLGWTEADVLRAFSRHPYCMSASIDKIKMNIEFFAGTLKWEPAYLSSNPALLSLSFEKRIVPRYLVRRILASKGLVKDDVYANYWMLGEKEFMAKFVDKYKDVAPEVCDAATGKLDLVDLEKDGKDCDRDKHSVSD